MGNPFLFFFHFVSVFLKFFPKKIVHLLFRYQTTGTRSFRTVRRLFLRSHENTINCNHISPSDTAQVQRSVENERSVGFLEISARFLDVHRSHTYKLLIYTTAITPLRNGCTLWLSTPRAFLQRPSATR